MTEVETPREPMLTLVAEPLCCPSITDPMVDCATECVAGFMADRGLR